MSEKTRKAETEWVMEIKLNVDVKLKKEKNLLCQNIAFEKLRNSVCFWTFFGDENWGI